MAFLIPLVAANNASSTLASGISSSATSMSLATGGGALFPTLSSGQYFVITMTSATTGIIGEIMHVTAVSGDTFTIVRAQEGTTAQSWNATDIVSNFWTAGQLATALGLLSYPVVGSSRNAAMLIGSASATATFTADEIVVQTSLGGQAYQLASFNKTINLGTTGAGGMDTGSPPSSGFPFVGVYAIYNPTTGATALLATNATSSVVPEIYGGGAMPTGYTASALVSVWAVAGGQFVAGSQLGRKVVFSGILVLSTGTNITSSQSIAPAVPMNARFFSLYADVGSTAAAFAGANFTVYASASTGTFCGQTGAGSAGVGSFTNVINDVQITTPQLMFYSFSLTTGAPTVNVNVFGYEF